MGRDKALLPHPAGGTLLERAADLAATISEPVRLLSGNGRRYTRFDLPEIADASPAAGPLGGIVAALRDADGIPALMLPVDLPALTPRSLLALRNAYRDQLPALAVAEAGGRLHPVPGIWGPDCLAPAEKALREGRLALMPLTRELGALPVALPEEELANWNRPEDF